MSKEDLEKYYEILELDPNASLSEIDSAYMQLKQLYSEDSIATFPLAEEFTEDYRREILDQIEIAYTKLRALFENEERDLKYTNDTPHSDDRGLKAEMENIAFFTGEALKKVREKLGVDLIDISATTKIRINQLKNIEREEFAELPPEVFVRGFVTAYAKQLSLDPERVVNDYMKRYEIWKRTLRG